MKSKNYCSLPNCHNCVWILTVTLLYTSSKSHEIRLLNYCKHPFFPPLLLILFAHFHPQCFHLINLLHNKCSILIPWQPLQNCFKIGNCKKTIKITSLQTLYALLCHELDESTSRASGKSPVALKSLSKKWHLKYFFLVFAPGLHEK